MHAAEGLSIAELIYWVPTGIVSLHCVFKHGFSKQMGWYSLTMLALFRIIGAITEIISVYHPSSGVLEASFICSSIGLMCLIGALSGITLRVNMNMCEKSIISPRLAKIIQTPTLAALILSILAGTKIGDGTPEAVATALKYFKISIGIVTAVYIVSAVLAIITFRHRAFVLESEQLFVKITVVSIPFITVRIVFSWLACWLPTTSSFFMLNRSTTSIIIKAIMATAPEMIVAGMYFYAGVTVDNKTAPSAATLKAATKGGLIQFATAKVVQYVPHKQQERV